MPKYDHKELEKRIQDRWDADHTFRTAGRSTDKKYYVLDFFPYPSGAGLHVGHPLGYIGSDIIARKRRMEGFNVLHPMGWDAFGLPAENYAIKTGVHPRESTWKNIENFRRQMKMIGFSYDWSREINSADPSYYRWTQWFFLFLYKKGLAYKATGMVNWCENDQTVLANEQVINGNCDRCKNPVTQKELSQWYFKVTAFADRLIEGLDRIDWADKVKAMQRNWIGKSEGAQITFEVLNPPADTAKLTVFTTRPDTLFGATFLVVAPESPLALSLASEEQRGAVEEYRAKTASASELDRQMADRPKTGVFTGTYVKHPLTGEKVPVWVADYVLAGYGTGAIMAVPAHDERDHAFAKAHDLPIVTVIEPVTGEPQQNPEHRRSIVALVEDADGKILTINWGSANGGHLFVGGGRDGDEDPEVCARREIAEETGYTDLELLGVSETIHHNYFAHSKNVARAIDAIGLHFKLKSAAKTDTKHEADEAGKFKVEWLSRNEAASKVGDALHAYVFQKFVLKQPYTERGIMANSGAYTGKTSEEGGAAIVAALGKDGIGKAVTTYRLRDWLVSRQRYWGAPIPIVYCEECGEVPVPEDQLPVTLPDDVDFRPTGESPLARSVSFHIVKCPSCGGDRARRESDTMDTFVDSSWYFLRFPAPFEDKAPFNADAVKQWLPVDMYVGGAEHAVLHLLYARFFTKALFDEGLVEFDEPFTRLRNQGHIQGEDGQKMSKSVGNVVNPDDVVTEFGADTLRVYEMFMGDFAASKPWDTKGITGTRRFLDRFNDAVHEVVHGRVDSVSPELERALHKTVKKVGDDIEAFKFNTAVSAMMILLNEWEGAGGGSKEFASTFVKLLSPFAPHLCEELWAKLGHEASIAKTEWPTYDAALLKDSTVSVVIQVNGKVRDRIEVAAGLSQEEVLVQAKSAPKTAAMLEGKTLAKVIYVQDKLLNLVIQ